MMSENINKGKYFNEDGHLSELGVAVFVEYLQNPDKGKIAHAIRKHVEDCFDCKKIIMENNDLLFEKSQLESNAESKTKPHFSIGRRKLYLAIAAVFIAVFCFAWYFVFDQNNNPDYLFDKYYEAYPNIMSGRGEPAILDESDGTFSDSILNFQKGLLNKAMINYSLKEYDSAVILLQKFNELNTDIPSVLFYLGNAYLGMGEAKKAIEPLRKASLQSSNYQAPAKWYLALAYLKNDELDKAQILLKEIVSSNGKFGRLARKLLRKLD